ncbi:ABC transporter permease [Enterococcus sp. AZ072]|uniref:ABC transporter permease n=1 Tax=unclassified Enterococcus TaxID=2608891 RepID=UPI003D2DF1D8
MRTSMKYMFRKMKNHFGQLLGMGLLILIASLFFSTLFSFKDTYEQTTKNYFASYHYADVTLQGKFQDNDIAALKNDLNASNVEGRWVHDVKKDDLTTRLISQTQTTNQLKLEKGRLAKTKDECAVISQYARMNKTQLGDTLIAGDQILKVVGIVSSPEYVYYVQNARTMIADKENFAIAFVSEDFSPVYNQILLRNDQRISEKQVKKIVAYEAFTRQTDQINYQMFEGDLDQFVSFAYIFPTIFWLLSFGIIFILLRRTILKEHKQIGVMKALGRNNWGIIKIYTFQFVLMGLLSSIAGCLLSLPVSKWLLTIFASMIEVPDLTADFNPLYWLITIGVSTIGCWIFSILSMLDILREYPYTSMSPRVPKISAKRRNSKVWKYVSFNTRYAFKTSLRNKGRFFLMILGIAASAALLVFSFGFNDSLKEVTNQYFRTFASYDLIIESQPQQLTDDLVEDTLIQKEDKALQMVTKVNGEEYSLIILDGQVDTLELADEMLREGIIIPEYYAEKWQVTVGDTIKIDDRSVKVSCILPLGMGLSIFTSYDYAESIFDDLPRVYNTLYVQSDRPEKLEQHLKNQNMVFTTANNDREMFRSLLDNMGILIIFLIICSVILGITVIMCMNLMNLTVREFEYMFMNIMGYSKRRILSAIGKETLLQLILAIPLGFFLGYQLLQAIKGEFSQNTFALYPIVSLKSYLISTTIVFLMGSTRILLSNRYIEKLDIVEGLKVQED